ncbi:MAG TPA: T9SS type A sorting domain-containing protein, partial [Catalimonadaceae bacterium]|nr:T9SS type A sorting domain-containing protein [Catalimonadaceae bacterium]
AISNACTSAVSQPSSVSVSPIPSTPIITMTGNNTCSVILSTSGGTTYLWYLGADIQTVTTSSFTLSSSGSYTVKAVSVESCTSTVSQPVSATVVDLLPAASISASGATSFCQGDSVVLTASGAASGSQYTWSNGPGGNTLVVKTAGIYTATYTNLGCNSLISNSISIEVKPLPAAIISQTGNELMAINVPGATYQWLLNGQEIQGAIQASYLPDVEGNHSVRVTLNGCPAVSNIIFFQFVGIEKRIQFEVKMFPNPALGWVEVETSAHGNPGIRVADQLGRVVLVIPSFQKKTRFRLPTGLYFVTIKFGENQTVKTLVVL